MLKEGYIMVKDVEGGSLLATKRGRSVAAMLTALAFGQA